MIHFVFASLRYHWRTNAAVALGVAVAVGVLVGVLVVGDSMRESLRRLALDRLGRIDDVLVSDHFFRAALADELAATDGFAHGFDRAVPVLLVRGSLARPSDSGEPTRANRVNVIGCDERFWRLDRVDAGQIANLPRGRSIVLNRPLAEQLGVAVGDVIHLRLARPGAMPAESALGRPSDLARLRLRVGAIIEPTGLGGFGLNPSQQSPRNAYVALDTLQERLDQPGRANAILVATRSTTDAPPESEKQLAALLRPRLSDYGLQFMQSPRGYSTLSTDRLLFSQAAESAVERALQPSAPDRPIQPALTWLANTIACGGHEIPYSTITAVDFATAPPLGPILDQNGKPLGTLADDEIVLNSWAADDLGAKLGDTIRVTYFEPESLDGSVRERTESLRLAAIVPLAGAAADRDLLLRLPGVTDRLSMDDWDPPFPLDTTRIRPKDEDYWRQYRGTPKAFVSLATGRRLWASRFGRTTTLRVALRELNERVPGTKRSGVPENQTAGPPLRYGPGTHGEEVSDEMFEAVFGSRLPPAAMGLVFQPIRRQSLAASAGTTSFNLLFLGFSFFIIVSGLLLVVLLFRLGVELRRGQIGLLLAVGWTERKVARALAAEGAMVAAAGSILGTGLGVGYAALMLLGLETWWLPAIGTPFLRLCATASSLAIGAAVGLAMSLVVILLSVRRVGRASPRRLMAGGKKGTVPICAKHPSGRTGKWGLSPFSRPPVFVAGLLVVAAVLAVLSARLGDEFQAGAFFGVGAMVLVGLLVAVGWQLAAGSRRAAIRAGRGNLVRLAALGAARHPLRSTLSVALVAVASFLIVSVSAFRVDPTGRPPARNSGNGGFALVAQSDLPIVGDLGTRDGRRRLGFSDDDNRRLDRATSISFRVRPGDDASCLNLYRPRQPRILGVPRAMIDRGGFAWAASTDPKNPWQALLSPGRENVTATFCAKHPEGRSGKRWLSPFPNPGPVPMVLERDTATYSLHLGGLGATYPVEDDLGRPVPLVVAGQLKGSPFQGDLLVAEDELLRHWPEVTGYRFFLIDCPAGETVAVRAALERTLGDYGFTAEPVADYLAGYLAVPNTYLSTFQSLGGLGLLLGTLGLAVVQWRGVVERRRELAVLRAVGLRRRAIAWLVMAENGLLLVAGLACGVAAAAVAVLPHLLSGDASIPFASLAGTLAIILLVGLAAGGLAVRAAVAAPLVEALREE